MCARYDPQALKTIPDKILCSQIDKKTTPNISGFKNPVVYIKENTGIYTRELVEKSNEDDIFNE